MLNGIGKIKNSSRKIFFTFGNKLFLWYLINTVIGSLVTLYIFSTVVRNYGLQIFGDVASSWALAVIAQSISQLGIPKLIRTKELGLVDISEIFLLRIVASSVMATILNLIAVYIFNLPFKLILIISILKFLESFRDFFVSHLLAEFKVLRALGPSIITYIAQIISITFLSVIEVNLIIMLSLLAVFNLILVMYYVIGFYQATKILFFYRDFKRIYTWFNQLYVYSLIAGLTTIYGYFPILFLSARGLSYEVAQVGIISSLLIPLSIINTSISQTLFRKLQVEGERVTYKRRFVTNQAATITIGIPVLLILFLYHEEVVQILYHDSVELSTTLVVGLFLNGLFQLPMWGIDTAYYATGKKRFLAIITAFQLVSLGFFCIVGTKGGDFSNVGICISLTTLLALCMKLSMLVRSLQSLGGYQHAASDA